MDDPEDFRKMLTEMGPEVISQSFRQPVLLLWMALPPAKKNIETLKASAREQFERVLSSFESDAELLELCKPPLDVEDTNDSP
ncbi:MAG: hypothetical protein KDN20_19445 [Verrucomicrobiae bacterium]|nr:hypothetical protein [Verrucomicrobiae bacterium]